MFHNLKHLTLIALLAFPLVADAEQNRGRGRQQQQRARSARAEAIAPPRQLSQTLLPAGARRVPTPRFDSGQGFQFQFRFNSQDGPDRFDARVGFNSRGRFNSRSGFGEGRRFGSRHDSERGRWQSRGDWWGNSGYFGAANSGFYPAFVVNQETYPEPEPAIPSTNKGLLRLEVTPASALDYYIDGSYFGSSSTLGTQFEINAGARQVEIRSRGYKSLAIDTRIDEGRVTTWRGSLEPAEPAQPPRSTGSRVMYVIPGCYIGNTKPEPRALPTGCDIKKLITRPGL